MFVDDPMGNKQSVKGAGMVPNFVEKKVRINVNRRWLYFYSISSEIVILKLRNLAIDLQETLKDTDQSNKTK